MGGHNGIIIPDLSLVFDGQHHPASLAPDRGDMAVQFYCIAQISYHFLNILARSALYRAPGWPAGKIHQPVVIHKLQERAYRIIQHRFCRARPYGRTHWQQMIFYKGIWQIASFDKACQRLACRAFIFFGHAGAVKFYQARQHRPETRF